MMNSVQIDGFVEDTPMLREFEDGKGMAIWIIRHERKAKSGVIMYNTFKCVAWDHLKDVAMGLSKGDFIRVNGSAQSYRHPETGELAFQIAAGTIQRRKAPEALTEEHGKVVNYG